MDEWSESEWIHHVSKVYIDSVDGHIEQNDEEGKDISAKSHGCSIVFACNLGVIQAWKEPEVPTYGW